MIMKTTSLIILFVVLSASLLTGCVVRFVEPGVYPVYNSAPATYYAPPIYGAYYDQPVVYYNGSGYGYGSRHTRARAARPHGPTPFEVVFGKGALKHPHKKGGHR